VSNLNAGRTPSFDCGKCLFVPFERNSQRFAGVPCHIDPRLKKWILEREPDCAIESLDAHPFL
jgi:hypothetical protein